MPPHRILKKHVYLILYEHLTYALLKEGPYVLTEDVGEFRGDQMTRAIPAVLIMIFFCNVKITSSLVGNITAHKKLCAG